MLFPTRKQVDYLNYLAGELGYRNGHAFFEDMMPTEIWNKCSVSRCIVFALQKLRRTATTQKGRDKAKAALRH